MTHLKCWALWLVLFTFTGYAESVSVSTTGTLFATQSVSAPLKKSSVDTDYSFRLVAGNGNLGTGSAIIIHGMFDNYKSMAPAAERFRKRFGWRNVYSFAYPWSVDGVTAAKKLGEELDRMDAIRRSVTLVAHSRGGLIARYAIERLGKGRKIDKCIFLATPHEGSLLANLGDNWFSFQKLWWDAARLYRPDPKANAACLKELMPNSAFLKNLNSPCYGRRDRIDYYLFRGDGDVAVGQKSGLANEIQFEGITSGGVERLSLPGVGHSSILEEKAVEAICQFILDKPASPLHFLLDPSPANATQTGWTLGMRITNSSNKPVTLNSVSFELFDRHGFWLTTQWYKPSKSGELLPSKPVPWDEVLGGLEATTLNVSMWPSSKGPLIDAAPPQLRAGTTMMAVTFTYGKRKRTETMWISRHYDSIWPDRRASDILSDPCMIEKGPLLRAGN